MRAVSINVEAKGSDRLAPLEMRTICSPRITDKQVRVAVRAVSVNRADILTRAGAHAHMTPGGAPQIVGLDAGGEVIEVGTSVVGINVGDRVMAMVAGGLAEEVVINADMAIPIPERWSFTDGAAAVLGLMTEHNALVTAGKMVGGEVIVVHAATSGVGTQGIQLARYLGARRIIATARSLRAREVLEGLGATDLIDTREQGLGARVQEITEGVGADIILDHVGGSYLADNLAACALGGRIVGIGRLGGSEATLDLEELARKRLSIIGVTFRTRTQSEKADVVARLRRDIDFGQPIDALRPLVHRCYDWTEAARAHSELENSTHIGKIVLEIT